MDKKRDYVEQYEAGVIQSVTRMLSDGEKDEVIQENLNRNMEMIDYQFGDRRYSRTKLIVFPEFFLTGFTESRSLEDYIAASIELPGKYTQPISDRAKKYGIYIAGNSYEYDPRFSDSCFNTSWIIDPEGEMILKYRKLNATQMGIVCYTNPADMYSACMEHFDSIDDLFPVVDTPIGRLACLTAYDINFPELARCLVLKGAEILIMPTGEGYYYAKQHRLMRRARCYENSCYLVTANHGEFIGGRPRFVQRGYSEIFDMNGDSVATIDGPGEATLSGLIDLRALRLKRSRTGFFNFVVNLRASLYAQIYKEAPTWPLDHWGKETMKNSDEASALGKEILEGLYEKDIFVRP